MLDNKKIKCTVCHIEKIEDLFSMDRGKRKIVCRRCCTDKQDLYRKTKVGVIRQIYQTQKQKSKVRGHSQPKYSFEELHEWIVSHDIFDILFKQWEDSGYLTDLKPSIDRLDNSKGYSFDNIRLVTWHDNNYKEFENKLNGINTDFHKPINQYSLDGTYIKTFIGIRNASRELNCLHSGIMRCCKGTQKYAYGFKWEYA